MYGKIHQRKLKEEDYNLSCEMARQKLDEYINIEAKRVNVDSAKKNAVMQHMDYQGFRQMVLGANIFPSKAGQLETAAILENSLSPNKLYSNKQKNATESSVGESELHCFSFRDFKKKFMNSYSLPLTKEKAQVCSMLLKSQNEQRLSRIFGIDCDASILAKISFVFLFLLEHINEYRPEQLRNQASFQVMFFEKVLNFKQMEMPLSILSKGERASVEKCLQQSMRVIPEEERKVDGLVGWGV